MSVLKKFIPTFDGRYCYCDGMFRPDLICNVCANKNARMLKRLNPKISIKNIQVLIDNEDRNV